MEEIRIIQGDSSDEFVIKLKDVIFDENWTCTIFVSEGLAGCNEFMYRMIDVDIDNNQFITKLTPNETSDLQVGSYLLGFELENQSIEFRREIHFKLKITKQGLVN